MLARPPVFPEPPALPLRLGAGIGSAGPVFIPGSPSNVLQTVVSTPMQAMMLSNLSAEMVWWPPRNRLSVTRCTPLRLASSEMVQSRFSIARRTDVAMMLMCLGIF